MGKRHAKGMNVIGRMPQSGVTIYERQGQVVVRPAQNSSRPHSCTLKQFVQRQRMRHSIALWTELSRCDVMFTEHKSAYSGFVALANRLPAVFVDKDVANRHASFLMPDIPVSEGKLLTVRQHLGEVDGNAALIASMVKNDVRLGAELWLYTAEEALLAAAKSHSNRKMKIELPPTL